MFLVPLSLLTEPARCRCTGGADASSVQAGEPEALSCVFEAGSSVVLVEQGKDTPPKCWH